MKKIKLIILLLLFCISVQAQFTVIRIIDGDTFEVVEATTEQHLKVRLSQIDCPEKDQPYGLEAKQFLERLILNKKVDLKVINFDIYNRAVCECRLGNLYINKEIIIKGYGFVYLKYCTDHSLYEAQFVAKYHSLGVWKSKSIIKPWDFRRNRHYRS